MVMAIISLNNHNKASIDDMKTYQKKGNVNREDLYCKSLKFGINRVVCSGMIDNSRYVECVFRSGDCGYELMMI